jgi:hypothetical protein
MAGWITSLLFIFKKKTRRRIAIKNYWVWTSMAAYATSALRAWEECKNPSSIYADDAGGWFVGDGTEGGIPLDWVSNYKKPCDITFVAGTKFAEHIVNNIDEGREIIANEPSPDEYVERFKRNMSIVYPQDVCIDYPYDIGYISLVGYVQSCINFWSDTRSWTELPAGRRIAVADNVWKHVDPDHYNSIGIPVSEVFGCQSVDDVRRKAVDLYEHYIYTEGAMRCLARVVSRIRSEISNRRTTNETNHD